MSNKKDINTIFTTIIALLGIIISIIAFCYENVRILKITEVDVFGINKTLKLEELYFENQYTESFIHNFKNAFVQFNLENHSKFDIEIYGFYMEVQIEDLPKKILVPLEANIKGREKSLSVFLSDWNASAEIDKYTIKQNSAIEVCVSLEETCRDLTHIWFLDSGLCERDNAISRKLEYVYDHRKKLKCKYRIVCKDTFGNYYYSSRKAVKFIPAEVLDD